MKKQRGNDNLFFGITKTYPKPARSCVYFGKHLESACFIRPKVCVANGFSEVCLLKKKCCFASYILAEKYKNRIEDSSKTDSAIYGESPDTVSFRPIF